jgi:hypothetical protein
MCVLTLSTAFVWNISHSRKNWVIFDQKRILVFMYSTCFSYLILTKFKFSPQVFEKFSNIKFHENPSRGCRVVLCGRTDWRTDRQPERHGLANSRFSSFYKSAQKRTARVYVSTKINSGVWILDGKISSSSGKPSADGLCRFIEISPFWKWILLENVVIKRDVLVMTLKLP